MFGELSYEMQVEVPASVAWDLFGTARIGMLIREMKDLVQDVEFVHGDGGTGSIVLVTVVPGLGFNSYKEKFMKVDNENRVKEVEVIEGAFLDLGFSLYRVRIHVVEKEETVCIAKAAIEYDVKEEFASNASFVTTDVLARIFQSGKAHLLQDYNKNKPAP